MPPFNLQTLLSARDYVITTESSNSHKGKAAKKDGINIKLRKYEGKELQQFTNTETIEGRK